MKKKFISGALALSMLMSMGTIGFAEKNVTGVDSETDVPVMITTTNANFSVTVPSVLPIAVDDDGTVHTADNAYIINNSAGKVEIKDISIKMQNGWNLLPNDENFLDKDVNSKDISLVINNLDTFSNNAALGFNVFPVNTQQKIDYSSKLAPQANGLKENIANIVITVGWSEGKLATLAGTSWQFNQNLYDFEWMENFDYDTQSGVEYYPEGTIFGNDEYSYEIWALAQEPIVGTNIFGSVHSAGLDHIIYVPRNTAYPEIYGWWIVDGEKSIEFLEGLIGLDELVNYLTPTSAPRITFTNESNTALQNPELIDWMYNNATKAK